MRVVWASSTQNRLNQGVQDLAEVDNMSEGTLGIGLIGSCKEHSQMRSRDHTRLSAEREKALICRKEVDTSIWVVAIIQCVGEVERQMAGNQLKFLCHRSFHITTVLGFDG
jgi:hypothetical protein